MAGISTKTDILINGTEESSEMDPHLYWQLINLQQKRQEYTMEKRHSPQQAVLGNLDSYILGWCKHNCGFRPCILNHYNYAQTYLY